jgi:hypothetical protein
LREYIYDLIRRTRGNNLELNGFGITDCRQDIESEATKYLLGTKFEINKRASRIA